MSPVRLSDLPPELRRQVAEQAGVSQRQRPSRAGVGDGQLCPGSCNCGEHFDRFTAWERHVRDVGIIGHSRWSIDLGGAS